MSGFTGFPVEGLDFYDDLEADNSKAYWAAHRDVYERGVRAPMAALCDELGAEFGPAKVFRPYRDVRFAKDKSPYKTHQGGYVTQRGAGWYVQLDASGLAVGAGMYEMAPDQLARYRQAVDDPGRGEPLQDALALLAALGYAIGGDRMATRPRGVPEDHPRLDLLRHRSLTAWRAFGSPAWLQTPEALEHVRRAWREMAPLPAWLGEHVGPSQRPAGR